jgi:hypothetical protein
MKKIILVLSLALVFTTQASRAQAPEADWHVKLRQQLPLLGHRNWIMIVDSAYPLQVSPGIQTLETNTDQLEVTREVLAMLDSSIHVTPNIYLDAELPFILEQDFFGVNYYRDNLKKILQDRPTKSLPHEQLISKVDVAGKTFKILVLKTTMAIPYTSVFLQLDCKYWSDESEQKLRQAMQNGAAPQ